MVFTADSKRTYNSAHDLLALFGIPIESSLDPYASNMSLGDWCDGDEDKLADAPESRDEVKDVLASPTPNEKKEVRTPAARANTTTCCDMKGSWGCGCQVVHSRHSAYSARVNGEANYSYMFSNSYAAWACSCAPLIYAMCG